MVKRETCLSQLRELKDINQAIFLAWDKNFGIGINFSRF